MADRPSAFLPSCGWIELAGQAQLRLSGRDRAAFLHNFCTNDIKRLTPGQGAEAFLTNVKGRILGHIFAFAESEAIAVDSVPGAGEFLRSHLDRYLITEDVQIEEVTAQTAILYVFGDGAAEQLQVLTGLDCHAFVCGQHATSSLAGQPVTVRRIDLTNAPGFECCVPTAEIAEARAAIRGVATEVSEADFEAFRIDAGFPRYGVDLTDAHLAQEASRTSRAISFTKGCYLGQEPIARIDALGHVNRQLRIVVIESNDIPAVGGAIVDEAGTELGKLTSVGRVASSAGVGLGMVRSSLAPNSPVKVRTERGDLPGHLVSIES